MESELRNDLLKKYDTDLIFYNPARQDWHWKGSDKMIKAFGRFVKEENSKAHLLLAEWGVNIEDSKALISKLGISKNVDFLPALGKSRLVKYYNASDIILDSFNHTDFSFEAFGTLTLEALACGKPVITDCILERLQEHFPGEVPIANAKSTEQIFNRMVELGDEKERVDVGLKSREWIMKNFNGEIIANELMEMYEKSVS
jgi:glycosyltransferase involved in cell wall biosynthesis